MTEKIDYKARRQSVRFAADAMVRAAKSGADPASQMLIHSNIATCARETSDMTKHPIYLPKFA